MSLRAFAHALAHSFLVGEPALDAIGGRARLLTSGPIPLVRPLAQAFLEKSSGDVRWRHGQLAAFLLAQPSLRRAWARHSERFALQHAALESPRMQPVAASWHWGVPPIATVRALADWLWLEDSELQWFADLGSLGYRSSGDRESASRLHHYRYTISPGRSGSVRLIEAPKKRLARIQTDVLRGILEHVPIHPAAHGFVKGRSTVTFAAPHTGREAVLRMGLR